MFHCLIHCHVYVNVGEFFVAQPPLYYHLYRLVGARYITRNLYIIIVVIVVVTVIIIILRVIARLCGITLLL